MKKLRINIAAGMIIFGSVITNAGKAEAIIYSFSDYNPGGNGVVTANGFFDLSTAPGNTIDWANDLDAFSINLSGTGFDLTMDNLSQVVADNLTAASISLDGTL